MPRVAKLKKKGLLTRAFDYVFFWIMEKLIH